MAIKYSEKLSEKVPASLKEFTSDKPLTGYDMKKLNEQADLKLTESGNAFGINTSAWYGTLKKGELKPNISLLLRMYAAFFEHIPRIHPPSLKELIHSLGQGCSADPCSCLAYFHAAEGKPEQLGIHQSSVRH